MPSLNLENIRSARTDGPFQKYELPGLLLGIARSSLTGRLLLLEGGESRRTIGFDEGLPVLAGSNVPAERLGARMLERGVITAAQGVEIDSVMAGENLKFGDAMVKLGLLTEEKLQRTLKWHQSWLITRCLELPEVEATFDAAGNVPKSESLALFKCVEEAIRGYDGDEVLELVRQLEGWRFTVDQSELEFAYKLGAGNSLLQLCEAVKGNPHSFQAMIASSEDDHPLIPVLTVVLGGMASPTREEGGTGDGVGPRLEDVDALLATLSSSDRIRSGPVDELPAIPPDLGEPAGDGANISSNLFEGLDLQQDKHAPLGDVLPPPPLGSALPPVPRGPGITEAPTKPSFTPMQPSLAVEPPRRSKAGAVAIAAFGFLLGFVSGAAALWQYGDRLLGVTLVAARDRVEPEASKPAPEATKPVEVAQPAKPVVAEAQPPTKPETPEVAAVDEEALAKAKQHLERGHSLLQKKKVAAAVEEYKKAMTADPKDGAVHRALGIAYTMLGKPDKAVAEYKIYLELVPDAEDGPQLKQMISQYESSR